jgi:hypothetical protein
MIASTTDVHRHWRSYVVAKLGHGPPMFLAKKYLLPCINAEPILPITFLLRTNLPSLLSTESAAMGMGGAALGLAILIRI